MPDAQPHPRVNWRQAAGEGLVLVVGVLLALATQAWWEARSERQVVGGHVTNLLVELESNRTGLVDIIDRHHLSVEQGTALIQVMDEAEAPQSADSIRALVSSLTLFADFRPATAALDNLLGAGSMELIEDPAVQLAVSRYSQAIADHNVLQAELAAFQINLFMGYLRRSVPLRGTNLATEVVGQAATTSRFEFDPQPLVGSLEFENLLLGRIRSESDAARYATRLLESLDALSQLLEGDS